MNPKLIIGLTTLLVAMQSSAKELENKLKQLNQYADVHFHISNYALQGISLKTFVDDYMKNRITRSVVMAIPLHQRWDGFEYEVSDEYHPNYYLGSKAELYYYSFVDALVAREYERLSEAEKVRLDPMITAFNPMDRYAAQQIKRVLLTFPGVFSGIGEFTIHKEIVSNKLAGDMIKEITPTNIPPDVHDEGKMTLYSPALTDIFNTAAETGLVALIHNDIYEVDVEPDGKVIKKSFEQHYVTGMKYVCKASPDAKVIWAHTGLGRFVDPLPDHLKIVSGVLDACPNWSVDVSWDLVQQLIVNPKPHMPTLDEWVRFIIKYQDRVLWGTDAVMYSSNRMESGKYVKGERISAETYNQIVEISNPLLEKLGTDVAKKVRLTNYLHLFDNAKIKVREWEKRHSKEDVWNLPAPIPVKRVAY